MGFRALTLLVEIRSVVATATGSHSTSRRPEARSGAPTTGSCGIGGLAMSLASGTYVLLLYQRHV